jgi:hypothetical protein
MSVYAFLKEAYCSNLGIVVLLAAILRALASLILCFSCIRTSLTVKFGTNRACSDIWLSILSRYGPLSLQKYDKKAILRHNSV